MNDRKFTQIEISGIQAPNDDINGVYVPQPIVASILPANFPNNAEAAWVNSDFSKKLMLDDGDTVLSAYISGGNKEDLPITSAITKSGNNYYALNTDSTKFTFIMTNDVLTSIIVSNSSKGLNDTYIDPPSIKDMLAKADNFPTKYLQGWTAGKGIRIYIGNNNSVDCLCFYMNFTSIPLGPISEKLSGPNTYEIGDALLTFNIENNVLVSITFSGFTEDGEMLNGTYSKYGLTNYSSSTINYPKGYSGEIILKINASFIEKDGMKIYVDDNLLTSDKYTLSEGSIIITLKPEYVKTISSVPSHTIKINVMNYPDIIATLIFSNKPSGGGSDKHVVLNTGVSNNTFD